MSVVCPTVTAFEKHQFADQLRRITPFAPRIHIDLMDGKLAPTKSPALSEIWLPEGLENDVHLMYEQPAEVLDELIKLRPNMVIVHAEAKLDHMHFVAQLHRHGIKAGLAILQDTSVEKTDRIMHSFDHILVFSGNLGHHGGVADLRLLDKVRQIRDLHPEAEIGWDGGITAENAKWLLDAGVDVLNTGGYIQKAEDPKHAYATLLAVVEATK